MKRFVITTAEDPAWPCNNRLLPTGNVTGVPGVSPAETPATPVPGIRA